MMEHRLKILPAYIKEIMAGRKSFEVRKDDREPPYRPGDTLLLEEFAEGCRYTGRWVRADVGYVLRGEYCKDGYCIISITATGWHGFAPPTNADRIRAMSDEELAVFLVKSDVNGDVCIEAYEDCFTYAVEKLCKIPYSEMAQSSRGIDLVLRWLRQSPEEV